MAHCVINDIIEDMSLLLFNKCISSSSSISDDKYFISSSAEL